MTHPLPETDHPDERAPETAEPPALTDTDIATFARAEGWCIDPDDTLHYVGFARAILALASTPPPEQASTPDKFDAESVRKAFEESFLDFFGRGPNGAVFDQLGQFWLDRLADGRYEMARVDDAWTGWLAASRRYAHIETMFRLAKVGHEQMFARCQELEQASTPRAEP